ncbi:SWI/SNF and RSC complex subunit Ssr2 [Blastocladiella emersonii ATCC 22665]|nr:SWI/SNF and RSC complex subunit Ssr2 [Blastocladiella emersonii ATCC 22665]
MDHDAHDAPPPPPQQQAADAPAHHPPSAPNGMDVHSPSTAPAGQPQSPRRRSPSPMRGLVTAADGPSEAEQTNGGEANGGAGGDEETPMDTDATTTAVATSTTPRPAAKQAMELSYSKLDEEARRYLIEQTHEIIIPSYSAWFDMNRIHDVETAALPEFFNARNKSKTPAVYKEYRDFMVNAYRLNPTEYLTVTACRRNLAGDVCAIMRVHAFLEQWGLINYHVDPETRPAALVPPFTGHFRVTADTPRGLQPFLPSVMQQAKHAQDAQHPGPTGPALSTAIGSTELTATTTTTTTLAVTNTTTTTVSINGNGSGPAPVAANLALRQDVYTRDASAVGTAPATETTATRTAHRCSTCGVDCTAQRYHALTVADFDLCEGCYLEGRFPSHLYSGDFVRLDHVTERVSSGTTGAGAPQWTDQETLLLLEGIEMFESDWSAVAAHVGTKSRDACVAHFLALPIEDPYVGVPMRDLGPLQFHRHAFSDAENPVLSLVSFLAATVPPTVAATVAKAAREAVAATATAEGETAEATEKLHGIAATAVGLSAARAATAAAGEEAEMRALMHSLLDLQSKKVDLKLAHFDQLEAALDWDRRVLEQEKHALFVEKLAMRRAATGAVSVESLAVGGGEAGYVPGNPFADAAGSGGEPRLVQM